eukprot:SAG25_NODE_2601_length_1500_cov_1.386867_2_plen_184_part_01
MHCMLSTSGIQYVLSARVRRAASMQHRSAIGDRHPAQQPQQLREEAAAAIMASDNDAPNILCWAGIAGASGVSVGAFGAHALKKLLESRGSTSTFQTGVQYHLIHAVALLGLAALPGGHGKLTVATTTAKCWLGGIALFSGSLYGLAGAESACLRVILHSFFIRLSQFRSLHRSWQRRYSCFC